MANGNGSRELPEDQASYIVALGATRQDESLCTLRHKTPGVAVPTSGLRRRSFGILRATIHSAIRAPCRKDGSMKRAARFKTGSVVFDKRRKTWNYLWWEGGRRRSRLIGTLQQHRTKSAAQDAARSFLPAPIGQSLGSPSSREILTVKVLAARYERERMPSRHSTARMYRSWA